MDKHELCSKVIDLLYDDIWVNTVTSKQSPQNKAQSLWDLVTELYVTFEVDTIEDLFSLAIQSLRHQQKKNIGTMYPVEWLKEKALRQ